MLHSGWVKHWFACLQSRIIRISLGFFLATKNTLTSARLLSPYLTTPRRCASLTKSVYTSPLRAWS
eukprot:3957039-Amphidinium_carterae.1